MKKLLFFFAALCCSFSLMAQTTIPAVHLTVGLPKSADPVITFTSDADVIAALGLAVPADANYYIKRIQFTDDEGYDPEGAAFTPNTTYNLKVDLAPSYGYEFKMSGGDVDIENMTVTYDANGATFVKAQTWPKLEEIQLQFTFTTGDDPLISAVSVNLGFPTPSDPVINSTTDADVIAALGFSVPDTAGYYISQVLFFTGNDQDIVDPVFHPYTTYLVCADLEPKDGYAFPLNGEGEVDPEQIDLTYNPDTASFFQAITFTGKSTLRLVFEHTTGYDPVIHAAHITLGFPNPGDPVTYYIYDSEKIEALGVSVPDDANYHIKMVGFFSADGNSIPEKNFNPLTTYKLIVDILPNDGYTFPWDSYNYPDPKQMSNTYDLNGAVYNDYVSWKNDPQIRLMFHFTTGESDIMPTPVFSNNASWFADVLQLNLTCADAEADIYYTLDGTTPSATNGTLYTGTIFYVGEVDNQIVTVKTIAIHGDKTSDVVTHSYSTSLKFHSVSCLNPAHGYISAPVTKTFRSTVNVTIEPDEGYALREGSLKYTYYDYNNEMQTVYVEGTSFEMPYNDATLSCEFRPDTIKVTGLTNVLARLDDDDGWYWDFKLTGDNENHLPEVFISAFSKTNEETCAIAGERAVYSDISYVRTTSGVKYTGKSGYCDSLNITYLGMGTYQFEGSLHDVNGVTFIWSFTTDNVSAIDRTKDDAPITLSEEEDKPTGLVNESENRDSNANCKRIEKGQLLILRDGVRYNALGQIVE